MKKAERNKAGNKALADAQAAVETARALCDELRTALSEARLEALNARGEATTAKAQWDWHQKRLAERTKELQHQQRLVRALTEALADKYCPIPTKFEVNMNYRIAEGENQ